MNEKYMWYKHWCNAVDHKRECLVSNDMVGATKWADIAVAIQIGFTGKFGLDFGAYVKEVMGV